MNNTIRRTGSLNRRSFLKTGAAAAALVPLGTSVFSRSARAATGTITVQQSMVPEPARNLLQQYADEFQTANPGTQVQISYVPWESHRQATLSKLSAGNLPDILHSNSNQGSVEFNDLGAFQDAGPLMSASFRDSFLPNAFTEMGTFGLPFVQSPETGIFYRRDMFDAAGITPPPVKEAWSWDEMIAAAVKLTGDGRYGFVERGKAGFIMQKSMIPYPWSFGTDIIVQDGDTWKSTFDTQPTADAFRTNVDLLRVHKVRPESYLNWGLPEAQRAWADNQAAMFTSGMWWASNVESNTTQKFGNEFDVMLFPVSDPANRAVQMSFDYLHLTKDSQNPELALQFIEFVFNKDRLVPLAQADFNLIPTTAEAVADPYYSAENFPLWGGRFGEWIEFSRFLPSHPKYTPLWINTVQPIVQEMVTDLIGVDEGLADIHAGITAELAKA